MTDRTDTAIGRKAPTVLVAVLLIGTLVLPYVGGFPLAYVLIGATAGLLGWLALVRGPWHLRGEFGLGLVATGFGILALSFVISMRTPKDLAYILNFLPFLLVLPLAGALSTRADKGHALTVANYALAGATLALLGAAFQWVVLHSERAEGWGSDPIWSASAAVTLGFVALLGYVQVRTWHRYLYLVGPVLALLVSILNASRGPFLTTLLLAPIAILIIVRHKILTLLGGLLLLVVAFLVIRFAAPSGLQRISSILVLLRDLVLTGDVKENSGGIRLIYWHASIRAFFNEPWFGVGWGHRIEAIRPYVSRKALVRYAETRHQHADILGFGVAAGMAGLLAYLLIIVGPIVAAIRSVRDSQYRARVVGCVLLAASYFCAGLTNLMFGFEFHTMLYVCTLAILLGYCRDQRLA